MTWNNVYTSFVFSLTFFLGRLIPSLSFRKPNRKTFLLYLLFFAILFGCNLLLQFGENQIRKYFYDGNDYYYVKYLIRYFIAILLSKPILRCRIVTSFFIVNFGYCFQHIGQYLYQRILSLFSIPLYSVAGILICLLFRAVYFALFFLATKKLLSRFDEEKIRRKALIVSSSSIVVLLTIILNSVAYNKANALDDRFFFRYNILASTLFAFFIIAINIQILDTDQIYNELDVTKKRLKKQNTYYSNEKDVIEARNIKIHDLKHQLIRYKEGIPKEELNSLEEDLHQYDSFFKTGNSDVDIVLTEKDIICNKRHIRFTALVDGSKLSFLKDSDVYSLFGNILDNAIEAVSKLDDDSYKVISLSTSIQNGFISIHEENYFNGSLQKEGNNRYKTTKEDSFSHGFGLKSISLIADKYKGHRSLKTKDRVFILDIRFPLTEDDPAEKKE